MPLFPDGALVVLVHKSKVVDTDIPHFMPEVRLLRLGRTPSLVTKVRTEIIPVFWQHALVRASAVPPGTEPLRFGNGKLVVLSGREANSIPSSQVISTPLSFRPGQVVTVGTFFQSRPFLVVKSDDRYCSIELFDRPHSRPIRLSPTLLRAHRPAEPA